MDAPPEPQPRPIPLRLCASAPCPRDRSSSERWISAHVSDFIFDFLCEQTEDRSFHLRLGISRIKRRESNSPSLFSSLSFFPLDFWQRTQIPSLIRPSLALRFVIVFICLHFYLWMLHTYTHSTWTHTYINEYATCCKHTCSYSQSISILIMLF